MKKILIFYKRAHKKDWLTQSRVEKKFGHLTHFEPLGMVLSKGGLDTTGIEMYLVDSVKRKIEKIKEPHLKRGVIAYYCETQ